MTPKFRITCLSICFLLATLLFISTSAQVSQNGNDLRSPATAVLSSSHSPVKTKVPAISRHQARSRKSGKDVEDPLFLGQVNYAAGDQTASAAIGDVNRDGKPDLVVTTLSGGQPSVAVLLGTGDGTFGSASIFPGGDWSLGPIALGDVNGDGKLDVIIENYCINGETQCGTGNAADGQVGVLLGNGDGSFQPPVFYDAGGLGTSSVTVADVNRDGKLDIIASNWDNVNGNNRIAVLLGKGDGTFLPAATYSSGGYGWETGQTIVADVNRDGIPDILVADINGDHGPSDGQLGVLLGNGDGTFQSAVVYDSGAPLTTGLAVADLNGDGYLDVVTASCTWWGCGDGAVGVLFGNGDGTFQTPQLYLNGGGASSAVTIFDADRDGKLDIVATSYGSIVVLLGNGDGTFTPYTSFPVTPTAEWLTAGDLSGDGAPDLVIPTNSGTLAVMLGNTRALTTTSLISSLNPSVYGQTVVLKATVTSSEGTPTGNVIFYDGTSAIGTVPLSAGEAILSLSNLPAGTNPITAAFQGSPQFNVSSSPIVNQSVTVATTTTALTSSRNPVLEKQYVTYTAVVASQYGGAATGTVTFMDGSSAVATVNLSNNQATFRTKYKSLGSHSISAVYTSGDGNNSGSTSPPLSENVISPTKTTVTTSGSPSHLGQSVTFTAMVKGKFGSVPDGEFVTFKDGSKLLASVPLTGGVATYTTSSLTLKTHTISAAYPGDAVFTASRAHVKQVVEQ